MINYQQLMDCSQDFCGCITYTNSDIFSPELLDKGILKSGIFLVIIIIFLMLSVKLGLDWFIFKDYYPLKQKSPILSILLIFCAGVQILIYPMLFSFNFYTSSFTDERTHKNFGEGLGTQSFYRAFGGSFWGACFMIYFLRAMRIVYAHETHSSRSKSFAFQLFKRQNLLAGIVCLWIIIKGSVMYIKSDKFKLIIEFTEQSVVEGSYLQLEEQLFYAKMVEDFCWQLILTYCLWLQKNVNPRFSLKNQLIVVILTEFFISLFVICIIVSGYGQKQGIIPYFCEQYTYIFEFPLIELVRTFTLLVMLGVSVVWPLKKKKVYHMLLPTGRHYGFVKTMRDFLLENEFREVFSRYLEYIDKKRGTNQFSTLLRFWRQLITLKLNRTDSQISKINSIKSLLEQVEKVLFRDEKNIINNLMQSIVSLQESINNSDVIKGRYRQSINEKVDELEKIALERLDKIYVNNFRKTESYNELLELTKENKRVNLNMILLNLALIVDSENQFV